MYDAKFPRIQRLSYHPIKMLASHTGLDDSLRMLLSCFRKMMSGCRIRVRPSARRQFAFPVLLVTHEREEEHARAEGGRATREDGAAPCK